MVVYGTISTRSLALALLLLFFALALVLAASGYRRRDPDVAEKLNSLGG
jgi:hypothetical protein